MLERRENIILEKTEAFADRIVKMYKHVLKKNSCYSDILRQVLRSGTGIGANAAESRFAQSRADFLTKLTIALKEAHETEYWLKRLHTAECLSETEFQSLYDDNSEIIKILIKITGTIKGDAIGLGNHNS